MTLRMFAGTTSNSSGSNRRKNGEESRYHFCHFIELKRQNGIEDIFTIAYLGVVIPNFGLDRASCLQGDDFSSCHGTVEKR